MCRAERALVAAALALAGCVTDPSPKGWLPDAARSQQSVEGGWISVECRNDEPCAEGELISASTNGVEVLTAKGFVEIAASDIEEATLGAYHTHHGRLRTWTWSGAVSSLTHGWFAVVSVPMWLITGITASEFERRAGLKHYPDVPLSEFRAFARFPQGRPVSVDPSVLGELRRTAPKGTGAAAGRMPVTTSAPVPVEPPPSDAGPRPFLQPGQSVRLASGTQLRVQPKTASSSKPADLTGCYVLKGSVRNANGLWWFVAGKNDQGWVLESETEDSTAQ